MKTLAPIALAAAAAACAHNQAQPLPADTVPSAWEAKTSTGTAPAADWWRSFDDPILDRMIGRAKTHNLDLRIAAARLKEARAARGATSAELWPTLEASAGASVQRTTRPEQRSRNFELALGASWEADLFGRLRSQDRAAAAFERAVEADRRAVELLLMAEVAETYVEYRLRRVQLALSLKTEAAQAGTVRITRARFEQGTASRFDLERTLAALALTRSRIPEAQAAAAAARHRLAVLLAEAPDQLERELAQDRPLPDSDPLEILQSPAEVVARRPDVRSAEWRLLAALADKDAAEALRYPRITISGLVGVENENIGDLFDPASVIASLAGGLLAPLFDFGRIRAQIDIADARQEQAYLDYERTVRVALEEAQTAIIYYAQGVLKQKELHVALSSAQKAADFARIQYREGTLSLLEVLDAERSLHDAELSWSQATADVSVRVITIHRALGG